MDEEGVIDGTFNTHFLKLSGSEKEKNLNIAKTVPYSCLLYTSPSPRDA